MDKDRIKAILESHGVIKVTYKENPVWLEGISNDNDGDILVRDLKTNKKFIAQIEDLKE